MFPIRTKIGTIPLGIPHSRSESVFLESTLMCLLDCVETPLEEKKALIYLRKGVLQALALDMYRRMGDMVQPLILDIFKTEISYSLTDEELAEQRRERSMNAVTLRQALISQMDSQ
jgi:hypothetical protein